MAGASDESRPKIGQEVEGPIEDLAYGGAGVMRVSGWVIMVRGAYPHDRIRARIRRRRKGVFEGDLLKILAAGPERVAPRCPHLGICGGCALQGLDPAAQTRYKAAQAVELLRRIGKIEPAEIAAPWQGPASYFYRNKMEFTFAKRPWLTREALAEGKPFPPGPALGLHPRGVYQGVFNIEDCQLQSPLSNRIVDRTREIARRHGLSVYDSHADEGLLRHLVIRQAATTSDLLIVIVARSEDPRLRVLASELHAAVPEITGIVASINLRRAAVAQGDYEVALLGNPTWREEILGLTYEIGASSFFQTQTRGAEALIEEVLAVGAFEPRDRVLDLYCGLGAFSLPIARKVAATMGVEVLDAAVEEARRNAKANGIKNAEFRAGAVEAREPQSWEAPCGDAAARTGRPPSKNTSRWDVVVVDPPRSGLHPRALERLRGMQPPRIVYVSCNPSTLARDAGQLVSDGGYHAMRLRVFDLFPQTPHLESVLLLTRQ